MIREIDEQPAALARILKRGEAQFKRLRAALSKEPQLIVLVARGSSDNAALFGRYLLELTTGIPVSLAAPSVHTLYRKQLRLKNALVIGVSQSGEATDINLVLENCRRGGALAIGVTNEQRSSMASVVDVPCIYPYSSAVLSAFVPVGYATAIASAAFAAGTSSAAAASSSGVTATK